jgi:hypothetical protein
LSARIEASESLERPPRQQIDDAAEPGRDPILARHERGEIGAVEQSGADRVAPERLDVEQPQPVDVGIREAVVDEVDQGVLLDRRRVAQARVEDGLARQPVQVRRPHLERPRRPEHDELRRRGELLDERRLRRRVLRHARGEQVRADRPVGVDDDVHEEHRRDGAERGCEQRDDEAPWIAGRGRLQGLRVARERIELPCGSCTPAPVRGNRLVHRG